MFAVCGASALGCSLVVDFDESKIPGDDASVIAETGADSTPGNETAVVDSGTDTETPPDTTVVDGGTDTGGATDAGDTGSATDAADTSITPTDAGDTGVVATDSADAAPADDTMDAATADDTMDAATADDTADSAPATDTADSAAAEDTHDAAFDASTFSSFRTHLTPGQEEPAPNLAITAGTATPEASATFTINETLLRVDYNIALTGSGALTGGATRIHFHTALPHVAGGVIATVCDELAGTPTDCADAGPWTGTVSMTQGQIDDLKAGKVYVNIHTAQNLDGEIRGQIVATGENFYSGKWTDTATAGTPTLGGGFGLILSADGTTFRYLGSHTGVLTSAMTMSHIHDSSASNAIVFPSQTPTPASLSSTGTTSPVFQSPATPPTSPTLTPTFKTKLDTGVLYVNVHTGDNPNGEIRADLVRRIGN